MKTRYIRKAFADGPRQTRLRDEAAAAAGGQPKPPRYGGMAKLSVFKRMPWSSRSKENAE